jgi:hypothetical protein
MIECMVRWINSKGIDMQEYFDFSNEGEIRAFNILIGLLVSTSVPFTVTAKAKPNP